MRRERMQTRKGEEICKEKKERRSNKRYKRVRQRGRGQVGEAKAEIWKNQAWITGNSRKVEKGRTNELLDTRDCIKCCLARISREKTRRFVPPHFG